MLKRGVKMKKENLKEIKELLLVVDMVNCFVREGAMKSQNIEHIIPEIEISSNFPKRHRSRIIKNLVQNCNYPEYGYQIFSFIGQTAIGMMEGPPNTPYENGYFLFKFCINDNFPFSPPKFYFISNIFHPNISENGYVSVDIFERNQWTPALMDFGKIIITKIGI